MRIAATGNFGAVTWEMSPEMSGKHRRALAELKELGGEELAQEFERSFVKQVQGILAISACGMSGALCIPHLSTLLLSTLINGMGAASQANLDLLRQIKGQDPE